jgi:N-acetylneuraminic acid mutarotase
VIPFPGRLALATLAFLPVACDRVEAAAPERSAPDPALFRLPVSGLDGLTSYSWSPGVEVPWLRDEPPREIPFGELGRTPKTLLYLGFDAGLERELSGQPGGHEGHRLRDGHAVEGRQGGGLWLEGRAALNIEVPAALRDQDQWTVEVWVRPAEIAQRGLLALPGLFTATVTAQGYVQVTAPEAGLDEQGRVQGVSVRGPVPLLLGQWNHVAIVLDTIDLTSLRVTVNGEARAKRLPGEPLHRSAERILLGGGWAPSLAATFDDLRVQARAGNTDEFQRAMAAPQPHEELRLTFADGSVEHLDVWTAPVREPWLSGSALWKRGRLERVLAEDSGLRRVDGHWRRIEAVDGPLPRTTHASAYIGQHRILMFGGETRDSWTYPFRNTDDTWIFHTDEERWERLETDVAPERRCHQAMAFAPDLDLVILASGFENESKEEGYEPHHLADTWAFHTDTLQWERIEAAGQPEGFNDRALVYHPGVQRFLYVFGTQVLSYEPRNQRWEPVRRPTFVDEVGRPLQPSDVDGSQMGGIVPSTGEILLFGGCFSPQDDEGFVDDFYVYDPLAGRATRLDAQPRPSARVRGAFGWDSRRERFVLFGGVRSQRSERMEDLWTLDPRTRTWKMHEASGAPTGRGGYHGFEYDPDLDRFFLLAGRHSKRHFLADVWTLALDERAPGTARFVFDRVEHPPGASWQADLDTPGDSRVEFRFRAGEDGLRWGEWSSTPPGAGRYLEVEATLVPASDGRSPVLRGMGFQSA